MKHAETANCQINLTFHYTFGVLSHKRSCIYLMKHTETANCQINLTFHYTFGLLSHKRSFIYLMKHAETASVRSILHFIIHFENYFQFGHTSPFSTLFKYVKNESTLYSILLILTTHLSEQIRGTFTRPVDHSQARKKQKKQLRS